MYYNGRYYIPGLGKFASADTLVPDPANPQAFNRYAYVLNNPAKYTDPSGHCILGGHNGVNGSTNLDDDFYDCSIEVPESTNPTGETLHVKGILRMLSMLEGTVYENMYAYNSDAVNIVVRKHLLNALDMGHSYREYREITNLPSDLLSPNREY